MELESSKTQDQNLELTLAQMKSRYENEIKVVMAKLDKLNLFDPKTRNEIVKALIDDSKVELPIYYATDFFAGIKLFEEDRSFFLNNKELFDAINKKVSNIEVQRLLDDLRNSIEKI